MMNEQNEEQSKIGVDNMSEDVQHPLENHNVDSMEEEYDSRRISIARIIIWFVSCIPIVIGADSGRSGDAPISRPDIRRPMRLRNRCCADAHRPSVRPIASRMISFFIVTNH